MNGDLAEKRRPLAADRVLAAKLAESDGSGLGATQKRAWPRNCLAIHEAIKSGNDHDVLEFFKRTLRRTPVHRRHGPYAKKA